MVAPSAPAAQDGDVLFDDDDAPGGALAGAAAGAVTLCVRALAGERIDRAIVAALAAGDGVVLSRARVQGLIDEGRVRVDGVVAANASAKVATGAALEICLPAAVPLAAVAQDIPLAIVFEDDDLVVVDKPAGLVVHPAAGNPDGTLVNALLWHCAGQLSGIGGVARPGIVHRIDKDTSGLLVVAKSDAAHEGLARQFADHSIERAYLAVVQGVPRLAAGTVRGVIARAAHDRKRMAMIEGDEPPSPNGLRRGKHAVTHWRMLEPLGAQAALVECRLETGRTHQVRVAMAAIGHGLVGDQLYGRPRAGLKPLLARLGFARQALHAAVLGFIHPLSGQALRFASPLPDDMRELIGELRGRAEPPGDADGSIWSTSGPAR